jgi:hypothetical protein
MKRFFLIFALEFASLASIWAQGTLEFNVNFAGGDPPRASFLPVGGFQLTDNSFSALVYLGNTDPTSGSIVQATGNQTYAPVFGLNLVYSSYPPSLDGGGTAYSYEKTTTLTDPQIQELMGGQWYVDVVFGNNSYLGQLTPVPEPSTWAVFLGGALLLFLGRAKMRFVKITKLP